MESAGREAGVQYSKLPMNSTILKRYDSSADLQPNSLDFTDIASGSCISMDAFRPDCNTVAGCACRLVHSHVSGVHHQLNRDM